MDISDVGYNAGHVMAHYLLTGTYEYLELQSDMPGQDVGAFVTAMQACDAARMYELPVLERLAQDEVRHLVGNLSLPAILDAVEHAGMRSSGWFANRCLLSRARSELYGMTAESANKMLNELVVSASTNKFILKAVLENYLENLELVGGSLPKDGHGSFSSSSANGTYVF